MSEQQQTSQQILTALQGIRQQLEITNERLLKIDERMQAGGAQQAATNAEIRATRAELTEQLDGIGENTKGARTPTFGNGGAYSNRFGRGAVA